MKTSNHDFLEEISKKAIEEANKMDVDEPKLVWPESEEVRYQKPSELVSFKEVLMANSIQVDAIAQLLIEKDFFTKEEFFSKLKQVQMAYKSKDDV